MSGSRFVPERESGLFVVLNTSRLSPLRNSGRGGSVIVKRSLIYTAMLVPPESQKQLREIPHFSLSILFGTPGMSCCVAASACRFRMNGLGIPVRSMRSAGSFVSFFVFHEIDLSFSYAFSERSDALDIRYENMRGFCARRRGRGIVDSPPSESGVSRS